MSRYQAFEMPGYEADCDVCGTKFARRFGQDIGGLFVCVMCTRYSHMVHALRFVNFMADQECEDVQHTYAGDCTYCNLDCSCNTCTARKIKKFIAKWHAAR